MQIIRIEGINNSRGETATIGVVGSCRVHGPLKALTRTGSAKAVAFPFNSYTHTPQEALQYIRFSSGHLAFPVTLEPMIFGKDGVRYPSASFVELVSRLDLMVVEVSSQTRIAASGYELQFNYFMTHFVRQAGKPVLDWWRSIVRGDADQRRRAEELGLSGVMSAPWQKEVLNTTRTGELDDIQFMDAMHDLVASHPCRWLFVSHFQFSETEPVASRDRNMSLVRGFAEDVGAGYFDPSPIIIARGREGALKGGGKDIYHYDPDFEPMMGGEIAKAIGLVMERPLDTVPRKPLKLVETVFDRTMLDITDSEALREIAVSLGPSQQSVADTVHRRLLELEPDDLDAALAVASHASMGQRWRSALVYADHVLERDPDNRMAAQIKARALSALGEDDATEIFERLLEAGDLTDIAEFCLHAYRSEREQSRVRLRIADECQRAAQQAELSLETDRPADAVRAYERLMALDVVGNLGWAGERQKVLARLFIEMREAASAGDISTALERCGALIDLGSKVGDALYVRGRIRFEQDDLQAAIADFSAAVREEPDRPAFALALARAEFRADHFIESANAYFATIQVSDSDSEKTLIDAAEQSLRSMTALLTRFGRQREADAPSPQNCLDAFQAFQLTARIMNTEDELDAVTKGLGLKYLRHVVELEKSGDEGFFVMAEAFLEIEPGSARVLQLLAYRHMRARRYAEAVVYWQRLAAIETETALHFLQIARCWDWLKKTDAMRAASERCLELDPGNEAAQAILDKALATKPEYA